MFDPLHYLATLGVKPANLDQTDVYRDWLLRFRPTYRLFSPHLLFQPSFAVSH